jgi:hypothetical protein
MPRTYHGVVLLAVAGWLASGRADAPPDVKGPKLTAQEVAVRVEQAGKDPGRLLEVAALADDKEARRLRRQVNALLQERKRLAAPEQLDQLARRLTVVLPLAAPSPAAIQEVLGPPKQTAREILYRRYLEQWHYDDPVPLCVVFDCLKGQDPRLLNVLLPGARKP